MKTFFKLYSAVVMLAVILSWATIGSGQICGKTAYEGSPAVEFYVTQLDHTSYPQHPTPFYNDVLVQTDSNITLTCTAKEPAHGYPEWYFGTDLQPYLINWFSNSSLLLVPNCDRTSRKVKTCSLSLVKVSPRDQGKYFCQAANQMGCTFQELDLKVISGKETETGRIPGRHERIMNKIKLAD